jgi:hypothetical protein
MKKHLVPLALCATLLPLAACATHKSKPKTTSSWRIIDADDDNNPFIHDDPERAGTIIKDDTH